MKILLLLGDTIVYRFVARYHDLAFRSYFPTIDWEDNIGLLVNGVGFKFR